MPDPLPNTPREHEKQEGYRLPERGYLRVAEEHSRILAQLASSIGGPNLTIETLEAFLKQCPQVAEGSVRYLVSGGFAVEIASRELRSHKDIDIVLLADNRDAIKWVSCKLDMVKPETYFGHLNLASQVLLGSTIRSTTRPEGHGAEVHIVHPAFLLVQKSSDFYGKAPRNEDIQDAKSLARLLARGSLEEKREWSRLLSFGLDALPEHLARKARERLTPVIEHLRRFDGGLGSSDTHSL